VCYILTGPELGCLVKKTPSSAFTTYNQGLPGVLKNIVLISAPATDLSNAFEFEAIWDTGATKSVITEKVISKCGLKPTGMVKMHGVTGTADAETYLVEVVLPNRVLVGGITAAKANLVGSEDVLIGMDIISLGDLAISSFYRKTSFSFRIPSIGRVDFLPAKERPKDVDTYINNNRIGRNDPCFCGSKRKYKNCCGK